MSKHPLDHGHDASAARMGKFAEMERAKKPSDAAKTLQQRAKTVDDSRLEKFTKIERDGPQ